MAKKFTPHPRQRKLLKVVLDGKRIVPVERPIMLAIPLSSGGIEYRPLTNPKEHDIINAPCGDDNIE